MTRPLAPLATQIAEQMTIEGLTPSTLRDHPSLHGYEDAPLLVICDMWIEISTDRDGLVRVHHETDGTADIHYQDGEWRVLSCDMIQS